MLKTLFTTIFLTFMMTFSLQGAVIEGLWEFDGNAADATGNGNDGGTVNNVTYGTGVKGQAAYFAGGVGTTSNYSNISYIDSTSSVSASAFNSGLSIMGWVDLNNGNGGTILSHDRSSGGTSKMGFNLAVNSAGTLTLMLRNTSDARLMQSTDINIGTTGFHHIAATWDGSTSGGIDLYIDGVEVASTLTQIRSFSGLNGGALPYRIGAHHGDSGNNVSGYEGAIDSLSLWHGALSAAEVQADFNTASAVPEPSAFSLMGLGLLGLMGLRRRK